MVLPVFGPGHSGTVCGAAMVDLGSGLCSSNVVPCWVRASPGGRCFVTIEGLNFTQDNPRSSRVWLRNDSSFTQMHNYNVIVARVFT